MLFSHGLAVARPSCWSPWRWSCLATSALRLTSSHAVLLTNVRKRTQSTNSLPLDPVILKSLEDRLEQLKSRKSPWSRFQEDTMNLNSIDNLVSTIKEVVQLTKTFPPARDPKTLTALLEAFQHNSTSASSRQCAIVLTSIAHIFAHMPNTAVDGMLLTQIVPDLLSRLQNDCASDIWCLWSIAVLRNFVPNQMILSHFKKALVTLCTSESVYRLNNQHLVRLIWSCSAVADILRSSHNDALGAGISTVMDIFGQRLVRGSLTNLLPAKITDALTAVALIEPYPDLRDRKHIMRMLCMKLPVEKLTPQQISAALMALSHVRRNNQDSFFDNEYKILLDKLCSSDVVVGAAPEYILNALEAFPGKLYARRRINSLLEQASVNIDLCTFNQMLRYCRVLKRLELDSELLFEAFMRRFMDVPSLLEHATCDEIAQLLAIYVHFNRLTYAYQTFLLHALLGRSTDHLSVSSVIIALNSFAAIDHFEPEPGLFLVEMLKVAVDRGDTLSYSSMAALQTIRVFIEKEVTHPDAIELISQIPSDAWEHWRNAVTNKNMTSTRQGTFVPADELYPFLCEILEMDRNPPATAHGADSSALLNGARNPRQRIKMAGHLTESGHMYSLLVDDAVVIDIVKFNSAYLAVTGRMEMSGTMCTRHRQMRELDGVAVGLLSYKKLYRAQAAPPPEREHTIRQLIVDALKHAN